MEIFVSHLYGNQKVNTSIKLIKRKLKKVTYNKFFLENGENNVF